MMKKINQEHITAFSQCKTKAYLLLNAENEKLHSEYEQLIDSFKEKSQERHFEKLTSIEDYRHNILKKGVSYVKNCDIEVENFNFKCELLIKQEGKSTLGNYYYEPVIFIGTTKLVHENRLELAFLAFLLEKIQKKYPTKGVIIDKNNNSHRIDVAKLKKEVKQIISEIQDFSHKIPSLFLNNHCQSCPFRNQCREKATQDDNLSLLSRITLKQVVNFEKKGIFTIKQLSFVYKPRRKNKKIKKVSFSYKPELHALSIRTQKVYIQAIPSIERKPKELFLDIEGLPDDDFYYLFGVLIVEDNIQKYIHFWANDYADEKKAWEQLVQLLSTHIDYPIFHYGSFESTVLEKLSKRYSTDIDKIKVRLVNINTPIFGKIYFPTYSNGLKELGNHIGAKWTNENASGLQTLIWRNKWENGIELYKDELILYNQEDCMALKLLTDELSKIQISSKDENSTDFLKQNKKIASEIGNAIHEQFKSILECSYHDYKKNRIKFNIEDTATKDKETKPSPRKGYHGQRKKMPKPDKTILLTHDDFCFIHPEQKLRKGHLQSKRLIVDVVFMKKGGVKKIVTEYIGEQGVCVKCGRGYAPQTIRKLKKNAIYGRNLMVWFVYQRISLQLPYEKIVEGIKEIIKDPISGSYSNVFVKEISKEYEDTEQLIIENLKQSPFIHADETPINIRGETQYVWVFTDGKYVILKLSKSREANTAHEFLKDYKGVLISDFFAGYDNIECSQQKCWVHLIRDLNNDLWDNPFDKEFEEFVSNVRNMILPIIKDCHKYGLKKRYLAKHSKNIAKFYKTYIDDKIYKSENCRLFQKRFIRYQDSLFTFIYHNNISWHNNTAERGIRHICKQNTISGNFHQSQVPHYLRLVSIMQTCRFQSKSFLQFLISEEKDVNLFGKMRKMT